MTRRHFLQGTVAIAAAPLFSDLLACRSQTEDIYTAIPGWLKQDEVPGLALAVIKNGKVVRSEGYGVKLQGGKDPVTADTVFEAASLSKPAFAHVVMQLWQEGAIDIDAPLSKYTP